MAERDRAGEEGGGKEMSQMDIVTNVWSAVTYSDKLRRTYN
jgi:hypothetical protein